MNEITKTQDKDLTLKQRKWIKLYLECGNATEAAMQVYDCKSREYASQIGYENIRKLDYAEFLEEAGISDKLLQEKIMEGLDATRTVSARVIVKKNSATSQADGELPLADSKTDDFIDVPDFMARHKYLETALKLKKRLVETKEENYGDSITYNFIIGGDYVPTSGQIASSSTGSVVSGEILPPPILKSPKI